MRSEFGVFGSILPENIGFSQSNFPEMRQLSPNKPVGVFVPAAEGIAAARELIARRGAGAGLRTGGGERAARVRFPPEHVVCAFPQHSTAFSRDLSRRAVHTTTARF